MKTVTINADEIADWDAFHETFRHKLSFPSYYGKNMDAWIDCMGDLSEMVILNIHDISKLKTANTEVYEAINECSAFVNWRQVSEGKDALIALSYQA